VGERPYWGVTGANHVERSPAATGMPMHIRSRRSSLPCLPRSSRSCTHRRIALALAAGLVLAACGGDESVPFGTAEVTVEPVAQVISTPATVVARTYGATVRDAARVDVVAPGAATLVALEVEDGAVVSAGQTIGRLRSDTLIGALRQAEAANLSALNALRGAQDALDRANEQPAERPLTFVSRIQEVEVELAEAQAEIVRLRAEGGSETELRIELQRAQALRTEYDAWVRRNDAVTSASATVRQTSQALAQARTAVGDLRLVAPVDGTVRIAADLAAGGGRTLVVGSDVGPGQAVATVLASGGSRIDLRVPEVDLAPVVIGATVRVDLEAYPGTPVTGRVTRIVEAASGAAPGAAPGAASGVTGATFTAEVALDDTGGLPLREGLTGTAVLTDLAFAERFEVRLEVDEIDVVLVEVGQTVTIELDALRGEPLDGTVVALAATPERSATGATVYRARVRLDARSDAPPLRGGLTGTGDIEVQRLESRLTVPSTALLRTGGSEVVFVVRGGVAVQVPVRVLAFGEVRAAIEGDLRAGERVVTTGIERVEDGMSVAGS
jgi:multidrug efflux pump subunit AcrA (membrane-fusion protein)